MIKAVCKCHACNKPIEVKFPFEPTEDEKLGWYCNECAEKEKE